MNKLLFLLLFFPKFFLGQKTTVQNRSDEKIVTEIHTVNGYEIQIIKEYKKDWLTYKLYFYKKYQLKNGVLDGPMMHYHKNGKLSSREVWINDKIVGEVTYYFEKGNLMGLYYYDNNGMKQGTARLFDKNGKLDTKMSFKNDMLEGVSITYFENGKIREIGEYKENMKNGVWKYYFENGQLNRISTFQMGCSQGKEIRYFESGIIEAIGNYKSYPNKLVCAYEDGLWKYFSKNGKLSRTIFFKDTKLIEEKIIR